MPNLSKLAIRSSLSDPGSVKALTTLNNDLTGFKSARASLRLVQRLMSDESLVCLSDDINGLFLEVIDKLKHIGRYSFSLQILLP